MHLKRNKVPTSWPIARKGTAFVVTSSDNSSEGIPALIVLRDMLKIGKTGKEVERILMSEKIKVNGKVTKDKKYYLKIFDVLGVGDKTYKMILKNRKFSLEETKDHKKISKVIGKKILPGNKVQINLNDGRNFVTGEKAGVGDSVLFDFESKKIEKIMPIKEGSKIIVIGGSHLGEEGKIEAIKDEKVEVILEKKKVNLDSERVMVI